MIILLTILLLKIKKMMNIKEKLNKEDYMDEDFIDETFEDYYKVPNQPDNYYYNDYYLNEGHDSPMFL